MTASEQANSRAPALAGYALLAALTVAGCIAMVIRFREGLMVTNLTQHVPWGIWISLYIYFIGLSAGSFLLSTLIYVFGLKQFEDVGPLALLQALGCLGLGMLLIWIDLGHPGRFFNVFWYWNYSSVLAWESAFYVAYTALILAELYVVLRPALAKRAAEGGFWRRLGRFVAFRDAAHASSWRGKMPRWLKAMGIVGIPIAIGVHGGTGAIFAVVKSRPTWYTGLFPIIFLVSALASGGALLAFLTAATSKLPAERKLATIRSLARLTVGILALDILLEVSEVLVVFYGGIPHHMEGWHNILFGPYWWVFWIVQLFFGALVPIAIVAGKRMGQSVAWLGTAGLLVVFGIIGVRLNIVIPAQIAPEFPTLPEAYHHVRYAAGYFPSVNELLVGAGAIALGVWGLIVALKLLPLEDAVSHEPQPGR